MTPANYTADPTPPHPIRFKSPPTHILAIAPNWLGDAVMATPALNAIKRRFPNAKLSVAGPPAICAILEGLPSIDQSFPVPQRAGLPGLARAAAPIRKHRPELAVVFPHSFRAALFARLTGARHRLAYDRGGRGLLLTHPVPPHRVNGIIEPVYMVTEYLALVAPLGCEDTRKGPELATDPRAIAQVKEHLVGQGPFVGIAPGAAFGPSKRWPAERFAAVADHLVDQIGAQCVLLTGPGEEQTRDAVLRAARHPFIRCDEGRPTIASLKAAISQLDLLVCNDSGPRHVAIAFRIPTICIMGSTKPIYSCGPYERGKVLRVNVNCGPCQKPVCATDHRCMTQISPEHAAEAALEALLPKAKV